MAGERIRRTLEKFLDDAEAAAKEYRWDDVADLANRVVSYRDVPQDLVDEAEFFLQIAAKGESRGAGRKGGTPRPPTQSREGMSATEELTPLRSGDPFRRKRLGDESTVVPLSAKFLELFYSYASEDEEMREKLDRALASLKQTSRWELRGWHHGMVEAGQHKREESRRRLESAKIILLLISPQYLHEQILDNDAEIYRALERAAAGEARVIPVRLKTIELADDSELRELTWLPDETEAVETADNEDEALAKVARGIKKVCSSLATIETTDVGDKRAKRI